MNVENASPRSPDGDGHGPTLATEFFGELPTGAAAPAWVRDAVAARWGSAGSLEVSLLSVSENASFLVRAEGDPVSVLRLNRPGYLSGSDAVRSEALWVAAIERETDVRVASPVPASDGDPVQSFVSPEGETLTGVMSAFVPGVMLETHVDPHPWFSRIGRETATLHEHARRWTPSPTFARFDWELEHMVGPGARWGRWEDWELSPAQAAVLGTAQERALATLDELLVKTRQTWGLIHADIRPSNVIVDGERMTIIDFDDCGHGWFLHDFASAMTWLDHLPDAPGIAQDWLAGYREVRPEFDRADALAATSFDVVRCLTMLGWCTTHRREAVPELVRDSVVETTCQVAEAYLASPTWLLD